MTIPVIVGGRSGRMSRMLAEAVDAESDMTLAGRLSFRPGAGEAGGKPVLGADDRLPAGRPVILDFTAPAHTRLMLGTVARQPCALVIGTSGLTEEDRGLCEEAARSRAVVVAANFSIGLMAVTRFVQDLAETTDERWDAGVLDVHFRGKADAVSATARKLGRTWRDHRPATASDPAIAAFRQGDGVSEHRLLAAGPGETIEILHRINHRHAFLAGILASVRFAHAAAPGLYSLEDVFRR